MLLITQAADDCAQRAAHIISITEGQTGSAPAYRCLNVLHPSRAGEILIFAMLRGFAEGAGPEGKTSFPPFLSRPDLSTEGCPVQR